MPADEIASVLDLLALPIPAFVDASYHHMLRRAPDSVEMKERCGALRAGLGRTRFLGDLGMSAEFQERRDGALRAESDNAFLEQAYQRYLGRQIDPQGMDKYLSLLARGKGRKRIIKQIAFSREARVKRTFWFELEQLLADERTQRHWFLGWFRKAQRLERQRNRMAEVMLHHGKAQRMHSPDVESETASSRLGMRADAATALGADARRVLARLRQATLRRA